MSAVPGIPWTANANPSGKLNATVCGGGCVGCGLTGNRTPAAAAAAVAAASSRLHAAACCIAAPIIGNCTRAAVAAAGC